MKRLAIFILFAMAIFTLASCKPLLPLSGSISGTVIDQADKPLEQVCIKVGGKTTYTNSYGYYSVSGLPVGSLLLTATKTGYNNIQKNVTVTSGNNTTFDIVMTANATGTIFGSVIDSSNNFPIANVVISFAGKTYTTNAEGTYIFANITPGTYSLIASKSGYQTYSSKITISAGTSMDYTIQMVPMLNNTTGALTGKVVLQGTNTAIAGANITLGNLTTQSNTQGAYIFSNVLAGEHNLTVVKSGYVPYSATVTITAGITDVYDIPMVTQTVTTKGNVSGIVTDKTTNAPLAYVNVTVEGKTALTNANGEYLIEGVNEGSQQISAIKDNYQTYIGSVTVVAGTTITYNFSLQSIAPVGIIRGYVTDSIGGPAVLGATVTYANYTTTTDSTGYFELSVLNSEEDDVLIFKEGRASARIQDVTVKSGEVVYLEVPTKTPFYPNASLIPPTINVSGLQPEQVISGIYTFDIIMQGDNSTYIYYVCVSGEQRYPDNGMGVEIDAASVKVDTTLYQNGPNYIKIVAYDINENLTILFVPVTIQNYANDNTLPESIPHMTAYSVTFGQNNNYYKDNREKFYEQYNLLGEPAIIALPTGQELNLNSFTENASIYNRLVWQPAPEADGYSVYRSFDGVNYTKIGDVNKLIISDEYKSISCLFEDYSAQLAPNKKTYYKVLPYNSYGSAQSSVSVDITPLPPFNVNLKSPANNATNVSITPTFTWDLQSSGFFPSGTQFSYSFSLFDAMDSRICDTKIDASTQYQLPNILLPNCVYSWDIWDGYALKQFRDDAIVNSYAISIIGSGLGSLNGEFIFTTVIGK